jgi:hypothetical protein
MRGLGSATSKESGAQRRSAALPGAAGALGRRYGIQCVTVPRGMAERRALKPRRAYAGEMHGTQSEQLHADLEKAEEVQKSRRSQYAAAYIWYTTVTCQCAAGDMRSFESIQQARTEVTGRSRAPGRPPTGGTGRAGPTGLERTHVLPESESLGP